MFSNKVGHIERRTSHAQQPVTFYGFQNKIQGLMLCRKIDEHINDVKELLPSLFVVFTSFARGATV